jgi:hypothetical protein
MYFYVKLLQVGYGRRLIKLIQSLCVCVCVLVLLPSDTRLLLGPTRIASLVSRHSSITALFTSSHSRDPTTEERERERET